LRDGRNTVGQIADWQKNGASQIEELANALSKLNLLSHVRTAPLGSGLFQVKARPRSNSVPASLPDVGFGIGQLLPVLVADLQLPKEGILAVCQPEIHLHPSVQADLAEHFVRSIHSRKTRYIIETHSEYFLNRLRALVAKGTLKPDPHRGLRKLQSGGAPVRLIQKSQRALTSGQPRSSCARSAHLCLICSETGTSLGRLPATDFVIRS
jgi:hypothetical protein